MDMAWYDRISEKEMLMPWYEKKDSGGSRLKWTLKNDFFRLIHFVIQIEILYSVIETKKYEILQVYDTGAIFIARLNIL
jgi:hypothetical protein